MTKIVVLPHDPRWAEMFELEVKVLEPALGGVLISSHHIGSTSIPGIYAKPVIDILLQVVDINRLDLRNHEMISIGYEVMGEFGIPERRYFRKDVAGIRTYQIHAFQAGSPEIARHLAFRNYLIEHPDDAQAYSQLKRQLAIQHQDSQDDYIDGKDGFIRDIDQKAQVLWLQNSS